MPTATSLQPGESAAPPRNDRLPALVFGWFAALMVALYTGALLLFVYRHSTFIADDLDIMVLTRSLSFGEFVLHPQDEHIVPLHRVVSYWVDGLAPRQFGVALLVLYGFQLLNLVSVYRILHLLELGGADDLALSGAEGVARGARDVLLERPTSWILFVIYGTYLHVGSLFLWWTAGLHRLPFLALTATAIYYYLNYRWTRRSLALVVCALCTFASFGFYTKAFLVPFYLIAIELCFWSASHELSRYKNLTFLLTLVIASCGYVIFWQRFQPPFRQGLNSDPWFHLRFLKFTWLVLRDSTVGSLWHELPKLRWPSLLSSLGWCAAFAYTVLRRPSNLRVWGLLLLLLTMNALATSLSKARSELFGLAIALATFRYYYELLILVVVFTAIALARSRVGQPHRFALALETRARRMVNALGRGGLQRRRREGIWVARAACIALLAGIACNSYVTSTELITGYYANYQRARNFLWRLEHDSWRIIAKQERPLRIVEGIVPGDLHGITDMLHSDLLFAWDIPHKVVPPGWNGAYRVTEFGHVVREQAEARPALPVR
ncbi:MAG TPA: hypothetical protein VI072_00105 [Polyangiaceae bacterium]